LQPQKTYRDQPRKRILHFSVIQSGSNLMRYIHP